MKTDKLKIGVPLFDVHQEFNFIYGVLLGAELNEGNSIEASRALVEKKYKNFVMILNKVNEKSKK